MDGVFAANVDNKAMKYGICTFSKNKIEFSNHLLLSSKKEQRGLLSIKLLIDNKYHVNIINTHLGLDKEERNKQIIEILNFKDRLIGSIIICGDFNDKNISLGSYYDSAVYLNQYKTPTLPKYNARNFKDRLIGSIIICGDFNDKNISLGSYYDSAVYLNQYKTPTLPKYNARIDYIFVEKNHIPKEYIVDKVLFSDHYPIICNF